MFLTPRVIPSVDNCSALWAVQLWAVLNDDHPQYLLLSGVRALTGNLLAGDFKVTGLGVGTEAGDAVPFEQAVKVSDAANGDVTGTYASLVVARLQGQPLAAAAPLSGQVLTFDGAAWMPAAPTTGGGGVTAHGALSGLLSDDHPQYLLLNGVRAPRTGSR